MAWGGKTYCGNGIGAGSLRECCGTGTVCRVGSYDFCCV